MKLYHLKRTQFLPISINEAWDFFSSPKNLQRITPATMGFQIIHCSGDDKMYPGQLICYKIKISPLYSTNWVTEITHVNKPFHFVDNQLFGPYALWHHQHFFKEVEGGVEMTDEVSYAIPYGILGRLANLIFVERQVNTIFDYRFEAITMYFKGLTKK